MYAMTLDENLNFDWKQVPDPIRKDGEVLIKVHAAAINRADLMQKDGCYASPPDWPQWCGLEAAGIVLEAPADCHVKPGDTEEAFLEAIRADMMLSRTFPKPFIHLTGGKYSKLHRFMGTKLGLAATFSVSSYDATSYNQPLISSFKTVRDLIPWDIGDIQGL